MTPASRSAAECSAAGCSTVARATERKAALPRSAEARSVLSPSVLPRSVLSRAGLLLAGLLLSACVPIPIPLPTSTGGSDAHDVQASAPGTPRCIATTGAENAHGAQATNSVRQRQGLAPVRPNALLARAAAAHACDMAGRGRMTHRGISTTGPAQRIKALGYRPSLTAENIAAGPYGLDQVLQAWNVSAGHLANILQPTVREYGIGRAIGPDGRTVFWSAIYAAPR